VTEQSGRNGGTTWQAVVAAIIVLTAAGAAPLRGAELLDRVIAVVSGTVITLSDARAAIALGLVDTRDARDPIEAAMQWLVDRRLVLDEALRYDTGELDAVVVDRTLAAIRQRFPSDVAYRAELVRLGLDDARVRGLVSDTLTMQQYLARRVDTTLPATDDELREYFGRHPDRFVRDNRPIAFEEAIDQVRGMLQQERRHQAVTVWLDRLRRRADVNEIYLPVR
jgi:hypothetical protein